MCSECGHYECTGGCPNYEPKIFAVCERCGKNIYQGDEFADLGSIYCRACLDDMTKEEIFGLLDITIDTATIKEYFDSYLWMVESKMFC